MGNWGARYKGRFPADDLCLIDLPEHDITNTATTLASMRAFSPELIVHCAAITDVDGCERNPDLAFAVNVLGTRNMAIAAQQSDCPLVYISTDYVFDGTQDVPYREYDAPAPQSVYARTKWLGERVTRELLSRFYIVRVAWLYGAGERNFVRTVLRLAERGGTLRMVTDECGSPTYAADVAAALTRLIGTSAYGTYHLPNAGVCSRYDWAEAILDLAGIGGTVDLQPSTNYQRAAVVPKRVALRNHCAAHEGIVMRPWREALADYMENMLGV